MTVMRSSSLEEMRSSSPGDPMDVDVDVNDAAGCMRSMLGSMTCWQTLPLQSEARVKSMLHDNKC